MRLFEPLFCDSRLQQLHPCPEFDDHISFDDSIQDNGERAHRYIIDGEEWQESVTGFVDSFFHKFCETKVIEKMMASPHWELSKYYGMTSDQIKQYWKKLRDEAAERGTEMHAYIEYYYNAGSEAEQLAIARDYNTPEFNYFLRFQREVAFQWKPWRTELRVFDRELQLPGSVDMLYLSPRSTPEQPLLIMYDWKRSKNIVKDSPWKKGKPPLSHLPDTNYWHYQLQLNIYKALIERNTVYRVESMALGVFHPNQQNYMCIPVNDMSNEIELMFKQRLQQLQLKKKQRCEMTLSELYQLVN